MRTVHGCGYVYHPRKITVDELNRKCPKCDKPLWHTISESILRAQWAHANDTDKTKAIV